MCVVNKGASKMHLIPGEFGCCSFLGGGFIVYFAWLCVVGPCFVMQYFVSFLVSDHDRLYMYRLYQC